MKKKDKHRERTGALFFLLTGIPVSVVVPALLAAAGFLVFIPYLNLASAVLLTPAVCILLYKLLFRKTKMELLPARLLTAGMSLLGAYVYICVLAGTLSGVFGSEPVEMEDMRDTEIMEYVERAPVTFRNAANRFLAPGLLWQDVTAWDEEGWAMIAAAAAAAQMGIPQLFIRKRPLLQE